MEYFTTDAIQEESNKKEEEHKAHTLLLVDDAQDNLDALSELLGRSYNVFTATDGEKALELIQNNPNSEHIQLIICDQRMLHLTGIDFLRQTVSLLPHTIRIILTGFSDIEVTIDAINQGHIYKFITKPCNSQDMLITVKLALETYELKRQNRLYFEELKILNSRLEQKLKVEKKQQFRKLHVDTMKLSLFYWEMTTQKSKSELAIESKLWSHYFDEKGTLRAKTLDRYLSEKTLPQKPKTHLVLKTVQFILDHCPPDEKFRLLVESSLEELKATVFVP